MAEIIDIYRIRRDISDYSVAHCFFTIQDEYDEEDVLSLELEEYNNLQFSEYTTYTDETIDNILSEFAVFCVNRKLRNDDFADVAVFNNSICYLLRHYDDGVTINNHSILDWILFALIECPIRSCIILLIYFGPIIYMCFFME